MIPLNQSYERSHRIFVRRRFGILSLFIFIFSFNAFSQETEVSGKVVSSSSNESLPGVNIIVKNTTNGAVTDLNGEFKISANPNDILVVSFLGYITEEIQVGNQTSINISLEEDFTELDEIVVIGYGIQKKKLITGATAQVDGEDIEKRNSTSALQALQGQAAGVTISSTSGQPGEAMKVRIRGVGSTGSTDPLYIVDGIVTGNIDYLNPSDIESIDVLKDAASAAIYGSRAANGVILVTTKQGLSGKSQVTFDAYYGIQNVAKKVEMLDSKQYAIIMNEQHLNSGGSISSLPWDVNALPAYTQKGVANTKWLDEMFAEDAVTQNYVLGASGGSNNSVYSWSLSYTGQEGIVGGRNYSNYERYGARLNSEHKLYNDRVKIGENLTFSYVKKNGIKVGNQYFNSLRSAFSVSPLMPVFDDDGKFFNSTDATIFDQDSLNYWNDEEANPYASMVYDNNNINRNQKLVSAIYAEIELIPNLKFRTSFGFDYYNEQYRSYTPEYTLSIFSFHSYNEAEQKMTNNFKMLWDNLLSYQYVNGMHVLDLLAGTSIEKYQGEWLKAKNANVSYNDLNHAFISNTTNQEWSKLSITGEPENEDRLLSYFGRAIYSYNEKYMLNATLRYDGSSKFAKGNRSQVFPSMSGGWVISSESFMDGATNIVSFLKLRGGWGQNGSNAADPFQYMALVSQSKATYPFGEAEGISENGSYPKSIDNPDLIWETSEQTNIGFDARLLNRHLSINFDWYRKATKDWLIKAPIPATTGTEPPWINGGNVINTGVELALSYNNQVGEFRYSVNLNGAYNKNKVTEVPTEDGIIHGASNMLYANSEEFYRAQSGFPISYFWGWETNGIFQTPGEITNYVNSEGIIIQPDANPGDLIYVDQNDDGAISDDDKINLGDPNPDLVFGLAINLNYKAFDFLISGNGVAGMQLVQNYRDASNRYANYTTEILGRWNGMGTSNEIPRLTHSNINYRFSDIYVKNGNYFRINNVTLGFDVASVTEVKFLSQCRIYAQVQNLYTFTKYSGMDPDVGYGFDNGPDDKFSSGIDLGFYPRPRIYLLGVNLKF